MRKIILALFCFFVINTPALARQDYRDVVYLKNGSIITGVIIEQIPGKSIKIATLGDNIFVYQLDEVEKITKELKRERGKSYGDDSEYSTGYSGILEVGYGVSTTNNDMRVVKFNFINGYKFPYFSIGFGIGVRLVQETEIVPVFADFRANFSDGDVSPYLALDAGYGFNRTYSNLNTLLWGAGAGISFKVSSGASMIVGISYENLSRLDTIGLNVGFSF